MSKNTKVIGISFELVTIQALEKWRGGKQHVISRFVNQAVKEKLGLPGR